MCEKYKMPHFMLFDPKVDMITPCEDLTFISKFASEYKCSAFELIDNKYVHSFDFTNNNVIWEYNND